VAASIEELEEQCLCYVDGAGPSCDGKDAMEESARRETRHGKRTRAIGETANLAPREGYAQPEMRVKLRGLPPFFPTA
jgi:hypothetical protein